MRWLLTQSAGKSSGRRYIEWLTRYSIDCDAVQPAAETGSDVSAYQALMLTGGGDVNPAIYGMPKHPETSSMDDLRDRKEMILIKTFLQAGKAVFGVCRGIQILNVALGGKLIQDIPTYLSSTTEPHGSVQNKDSLHVLTFCGQSAIRVALAGTTDVNSAHHQAIDPDHVAAGLRVTARSKAGIIEAVEGTTTTDRILAVQWHPERLPEKHPATDGLMKLMIRLAGGA